MGDTCLLLLLACLSPCWGQKVGTQKENEHLYMDIEECSGQQNCKKVPTAITLDHNWRWLHAVGDYVNCYEGNTWDDKFCPDVATCTENCALEGVDANDWTNTYGITTDGEGLSLKFVTVGEYASNVGSRTFLLAPDEENYYMFYLKNREFTFDVDVSELPCGLNGALYFVEMDEDGGTSKYPTNEAGASYGTGYCDAQCPHDLKFVNGEANCDEWAGSDNDVNAGHGHYGSCCVEMDIWEANSLATAYTPHPCDTVGQERCEGRDCGDNETDERYDGVCDKDGCDLNPWRLGDRSFYGPGGDFTVDTTKPMTVVTQFITDDGTDSGRLVEIRRVWVQGGNVIQNADTNMPGIDTTNAISDNFCSQTKDLFGDLDDHAEKGGLASMGESLERGMVLVMSMWDDHSADMLWLDGDYPIGADPNTPGVSRGPCGVDSGHPEDVEDKYGDAVVKFFNIKVGTIGSTYPSGNSPTPTPRPTEPQPTDPQPTQDPTNCPGGSLGDCIAMCPSNPPEIFQGCVMECQDKCPS